jgi:hypothetical protein
MTHHGNRFVILAIVATLAAGTSTQVQAQGTFVSLDVPTRPEAADQMEREATDLLSDGRGWRAAAALYMRAAELRGMDDLKSADNLRIAGYLQYYAGRHRIAVASLTEAGEAFLMLGDVEQAAEAFIDGAWVATQADMAAVAKALSERGSRLTRSPLLGTSERLSLVRRLGAASGIE